jgi:FMN phosphatase YigB (HAD superfamily)
MAKIAVDIDSTLYDFETPAREAMFKLYKETGDLVYKEGAYHPWTEWRSPADVLGSRALAEGHRALPRGGRNRGAASI